MKKQYFIKAYGDYYRGLKGQTTTIYANNYDEAYEKARDMFPEYKELLVREKE